MILPGSLIPLDKYFLKNLTFVIRISTRVATSPFQSNSLLGQGEEQTTKEQCPSWHMRTTKVKFFKKYLSEGMSDPGKIIRPGR